MSRQTAPKLKGLKVQSCALVQHVQGPGQKRDGGAVQKACSGVGSVDKDLIHRTAHYPAGRGWIERVAGYQSSVQDQILAQQNNVNSLFCTFTSYMLSAKGPFLHQRWDLMCYTWHFIAWNNVSKPPLKRLLHLGCGKPFYPYILQYEVQFMVQMQ